MTQRGDVAIRQPLSQPCRTAASKKLLVIVGNKGRDIKPGLIVQQHARLLRPWFAKSNEFHALSECLLRHIAVLPCVPAIIFDQTAWSCLAYMFHELSGRQFVCLAFSNCNDAIRFPEVGDAVCCGKCVFLPAFSRLTSLEERSRTNDPTRRSKRTPAAGACARRRRAGFPELASRRPHPNRPAHKRMPPRIDPPKLPDRLPRRCQRPGECHRP